jgi:hypothetical protein
MDAVLAPLLATVSGKRYSYGRCEEMARELHKRLVKHFERPTCAVECAIREFVGKGRAFQSVLEVLREQYLQNAIQLSGLYVDVSNDTVLVTKPKVKILPIDVAGLVPMRDIAHFRQPAERY